MRNRSAQVLAACVALASVGCGTLELSDAPADRRGSAEQAEGPVRHVWVAASGDAPAADGSQTTPWVVATSAEFDALMTAFASPSDARYLGDDVPAVIHLMAGTFQTRGNAEWSPDNWLLQSNWTLQGAGRDATVLEMDPNATQLFPIAMPVNGQYFFQQKLTTVLGASVPGELPHRQVLKDLTVRGNFSRLVHGGFFTDKPLKLGGAQLFGEHSAMENVRFTDFGSTYNAQETFVAMLEAARNNSVPDVQGFDQGCVGAECAHISDCVFDGQIDPLAQQSGMQITVFAVMGGYNGEYANMTAPTRVDVYRSRPYLTRNRVIVDESNQSRPGGEGNLVQGFTVFNSDGAVVSDNVTRNARMGFYSDSLEQKNLTITNNRFERAMMGVAFFTDQVPDTGDANVTISGNVISTIPWNDGARNGIFIRKSSPSLENESWNFYAGDHARYLSNFTIADNVIGLAMAPTGAYANMGIAVHEVSGLTITNNKLDARFKPPLDLTSVVRKDTSGAIVGVYDNLNVTQSGNTTYTGPMPLPPTSTPPSGSSCGVAAENAALTLSCPAGQVLDAVSFASYGTPSGACGAQVPGVCNASSSASVVDSLCRGKSSCTVPANNATFGDPCGGTLKQLSAQMTCRAATTLAPNGTTCQAAQDCQSGYCYPGPEARSYCIAAEANCAKPGTNGIYWNDAYSYAGQTYSCVYGVGLQQL